MSANSNLVTVDGHSYSKLSHNLQVTLTLNATAIRMVEDVMYSTSSDMEAISEEVATMLHRAILTDYTRGGLRRNLKGD